MVAPVLALAALAAGAVYPVDVARRGAPLNSVGAQATAGTARLLFDYPDAQRAELLDLLFKPQHGASFTT